jgi:hypothetical protein
MDQSGTDPGLRNDTLATNCLSHSMVENTVSCGYLHITTLQKHLILKFFQTILLASNCLMPAEIGCRLGGTCCLHHQGKREILASQAASSIFKTQISANFCHISQRHIPKNANF